MRTIKFRAWLPEIKEMGNVVTLKGSNEGYEFHTITAEIFYPITKRQAFYTVENFILMQYVGLKDKNGTEIFENDILSVNGKLTYEVRFEDAKFVLYHVNGNNPVGTKWGDLRRSFDPDFEQYSFMVIGDIYRNPELLKR